MTLPRQHAVDRYHRQMLLPGIGDSGQRALGESHVLLVGCGALGSVIAELLVRAGIGTLSIVDRDIVELTNLQRQVLFDEADAQHGTPKAIAAAVRLRAINSQCTIISHVDDFNARSAPAMLPGVDVIMDGLDNYATRYLLNDLAVQHGVPYIHGGAVGTVGSAMMIIPHPDCRVHPPKRTAMDVAHCTPCLRCIFPDLPAAGGPTCDTVGVLGPLITMIASWQATQAIKLLAGQIDSIDRSLLSVNLWNNTMHQTDLTKARDQQCPCCSAGQFPFADNQSQGMVSTLCGRGAVQVLPAGPSTPSIDLQQASQQLSQHGAFQCNEYLLRGTFTHERGESEQPIELTLFSSGRAIFKNIQQPAKARTLYARYVGN
jgi:molybdopterin/thiamine biosynthesis adenylyltransferase